MNPLSVVMAAALSAQIAGSLAVAAGCVGWDSVSMPLLSTRDEHSSASRVRLNCRTVAFKLQ